MLFSSNIRRIVLIVVLFCLVKPSDAKLFSKTNDEKWEKKYVFFKERVFANADSCEKAITSWLIEINTTGDLKWKSKALCLLGKVQYILEKNEASETSLQACIVLEEEINNQEVMGIGNYYLAMLRYRVDKYDAAIPYFKKALSSLVLTEETWVEANCRYIYGYVLYTQKKVEESREQLTKSASIFDTKYVDTKVEANAYNYLGDLEYYVAKNYESAAEAYKNSARVYQAVDFKEDAAYANYSLGEIYYYYLTDKEAAYTYYKLAYEFYKTSTNKKQEAVTSRGVGNACQSIQRFDEACTYFIIAADLNKQLDLTVNEAHCYLDLANIYYFAGNYPDALRYYRLSLTTYEKAKNTVGMAGSCIGLGNFYHRRGESEKAYEMFKKSETFYLNEDPVNHSGLATAYIGLGNYYYNKQDYDNSLKYYLLSIENEEKSGKEIKNNTVALMNIANIYTGRDDDENAEKYLQLSVEDAEKNNNKEGKASALRLRGGFYNRKKESQKALDDCTAALKLIENLGLKPQEMECYACLYLASYNLQKYQDAVGYYADYIGTRDSINNEKRNTEINKREMQHEYALKESQLKLEEEKKQFALQEEIKRKQLFFEFEAKNARMRAVTEKKEIAFREEFKRKQLALDYQKQQDSTKLVTAKKELGLKQSIQAEQVRNEEQRRLNNWLFGGLAIFGILMLVILKGYSDKRKANKIILKQKEETEQQKEIIELKGLQLEEKNKEIVDSINYARRLQEAILPPSKLVKQFLVDSFILYKPRDIVAGDFYWMETAQQESMSNTSAQRSANNLAKNNILFAVADCTGHGVPGAMVSVVCSGALNRAVKEFHLTIPGEILDKVRELVLETFEKSESQVKDGMDISLCLVDLDKRELKWAGANNPLWIMRNKELIELKPDKQPIGATENPKPFTTHTLSLQIGDILYMSTDGYSDQFGGVKGKKFKDSNMKKLLEQICNDSMEKQSILMDEAIESWRGSLEQVDDICVAGVRIGG